MTWILYQFTNWKCSFYLQSFKKKWDNIDESDKSSFFFLNTRVKIKSVYANVSWLKPIVFCVSPLPASWPAITDINLSLSVNSPTCFTTPESRMDDTIRATVPSPLLQSAWRLVCSVNVKWAMMPLLSWGDGLSEISCWHNCLFMEVIILLQS